MSTPRPRYTWRIAEVDRAKVRALAEAVAMPPVIAQVLLLRGVETPEDARRFLYPSLDQLSDPYLLTDMRNAVERIAKARDRNEHVLIFGDYDVDGIAATAVLLAGLRRYGLARISHGMPLRLTEGYGLNAERVETAHADGVSLIITVDNGISAHEAARRARELGVDLIITDHHAIENTLPDAVAVLNPKRESPSHPGYFLCGAGVAFKLACALNGTPNDLDIVALGTVADIVPLRRENRVIVSLGLRHMAKYERTGLAKLAAEANLSLREVSSEKICFQLGPRLNAAGRLDDGALALKLLLAECPEEASATARALNAANEERRAIERAIYEEAVEELDAYFMRHHRGIVLARRGWHAGVIGIVASHLQSDFNRPCVMISIDDEGVGRGSARSGPGFDMMDALSACQGLIERFGGHRSAAGLTLLEKNIQAFREAFEAEALRQLGEGELALDLDIDAVVALSQVDSGLVKLLECLEPTGHQNPAPLFCAAGVELVPQSTRVYRERHLGMTLRQGDALLSAIGFNMAERYYTEDIPKVMDIAFTPQFNTWRDETSVQLVLKDLRPAQ